MWNVLYNNFFFFANMVIDCRLLEKFIIHESFMTYLVSTQIWFTRSSH
jgi:hypothetical protein